MSVGGLFGDCWGTVWGLLGDCWVTVVGLLGDCPGRFISVARPRVDFGRVCGVICTFWGVQGRGRGSGGGSGGGAETTYDQIIPHHPPRAEPLNSRADWQRCYIVARKSAICDVACHAQCRGLACWHKSADRVLLSRGPLVRSSLMEA